MKKQNWRSIVVFLILLICVVSLSITLAAPYHNTTCVATYPRHCKLVIETKQAQQGVYRMHMDCGDAVPRIATNVIKGALKWFIPAEIDLPGKTVVVKPAADPTQQTIEVTCNATHKK